MLKPDNLPVTFGKNDVEIIARETLYRGFFSLELSNQVQRFFEVNFIRCFPT
ncbi:ADP-ribose pyrophosphatase [Escherichia coli]|nr:ADP-ribose pyrophosphatase [Escherichia coli]